MIEYWQIVITMILFSAFFSGMEIAFVSSNRLKVELDRKQHIFAAGIISRFYQHPARFIGALLLGNNIALVVYGIFMAILLEPFIASWIPARYLNESVLLLAQTLLSTFVILIFAEFLPKILFSIRPNHMLNFFAIPVWLFYYIFYPLIISYIGLTEWFIQKVLKIKLENSEYTFSAVDLDEYVKDITPHETTEEELRQEIQMFQNAIEFKNVKLRDCLVPRTEIEAIDIDSDIEELTALFNSTKHSKILVYRQNIDEIIGYVHSYDLFKKPVKISDVLRETNIYPETHSASDVLKDFINQRKSVAVVVDEFGGTEGMVSMEDIIEEIFGEIEDEYDEEETSEKQINENEFIFPSKLEIDYLNDKYKLSLPESDEYESLSGLILHHTGSIPLTGEKIKINGFSFIITKATESKIEEVRLLLRED